MFYLLQALETKVKGHLSKVPCTHEGERQEIHLKTLFETIWIIWFKVANNTTRKHKRSKCGTGQQVMDWRAKTSPDCESRSDLGATLNQLIIVTVFLLLLERFTLSPGCVCCFVKVPGGWGASVLHVVPSCSDTLSLWRETHTIVSLGAHFHKWWSSSSKWPFSFRLTVAFDLAGWRRRSLSSFD